VEKLNSERHIKYRKIIYLCIAIIIAAFVVYIFVSKPYGSNTIITLPKKQNAISTQTNREAAIVVTVIPTALTPGVEAVFQVQIDNHINKLNYDFVKIAQLKDNKGNIYKPLS